MDIKSLRWKIILEESESVFSQQQGFGPVVAVPVVWLLSAYKLLFLVLQQYLNLSQLPPLDILRVFRTYGQNEMRLDSTLFCKYIHDCGLSLFHSH